MRFLAMALVLAACGDDTQATAADSAPQPDARLPDAAAMGDAPVAPPDVPDALAVTETGQVILLRAPAQGVQIYTCTGTIVDGGADDGGDSESFAWVFSAPSATLMDDQMHAIGVHYAGPTWELADGSKVVGAKVAQATPDPSAIPWLLLRAVSNAGNGLLARVHWIQRLQTVGGIAPASGCDSSTVGHTTGVDYRAVYYFWGPQ